MKFISKSSLYIKMMYICDVTLVLRACDKSDLADETQTSIENKSITDNYP